MTETGTRSEASDRQRKVDEAKGQAQEQAQKMTDQARSRARGVVDERSTQAGEQIGQQAQDIRTVGQQLREQGKEGPAKVAEQAADRAERLGSYLRDRDADTILQDVERMARQNPWAVIAGGMAIGFVASRFLKASSRQRYEASDGRRELPRTTGEARFATPDRPGIAAGAPATGSPAGGI